MTLRSEFRYRWDERPSNRAAGIYAYFIERPDELRPISVPADGLLYIGMTNSSLDARCHFEHVHSGFSSLRRSLGAILKSQLQLRALPRSPGASRSSGIVASRVFARACDDGRRAGGGRSFGQAAKAVGVGSRAGMCDRKTLTRFQRSDGIAA